MSNAEKEREERIDRLWSTQEIRNLAYRYAYAMDTMDHPLMESLWVETKEPVEPPTIDIHVVRNVPQLLAGRGTSTLFVGNHLITFDGPDRATGVVYCMAFIDWGMFFDQSIVYQDKYERHNGKWLFRCRDHLLMWGQERANNPMRQPPADWPVSQIGSGNGFDLLRCGMILKGPGSLPIEPYRPHQSEEPKTVWTVT